MKKSLYLLLVFGIIIGLLPLSACSKQTTTTITTTSTTTSTTLPTTSLTTTTTPDAAFLETTAEAWINLLAAGKFEQAVESFDKTMAAQVPVASLEQIWNSLLAQAGTFKGFTGARTAKVDVYNQVIVTCEFSSASLDLQLAFDADMKIAGFYARPASMPYTPPDYADPSLFTETEVTVGTGQWHLPATLTMPNGEGPFPAVVLVHGSGPNDRDETIDGNKPFKDLAWGLASRGIAVLRYEKRTRQYPQQVAAMLDTFTVKDETIDDAIAAVDLLYQTAGIDKAKIFVLGHSLGGMLAPRIGASDSRIAGLVILAGPTRKFEDIYLEQIKYLALLDGKIDDTEAAQIKAAEADVQKIKTLDIKPGEVVLGAGKAYWQDLAGYSPAVTSKNLTIPMLILQGERDYQVTMADFKGWSDALQGKAGVTLKSYADLNHLFITGSGKSTPDEYMQPGNVAKEVIEDIAAWVNGQ